MLQVFYILWGGVYTKKVHVRFVFISVCIQLIRSHVYNATMKRQDKIRISSVAWLKQLTNISELQSVLPRIEDYTGLSTDPKDTEAYQV